MEAYCMTCHCMRKVRNPQTVQLATKRLANTGKCLVCSGSIVKMLRDKDFEEDGGGRRRPKQVLIGKDTPRWIKTKRRKNKRELRGENGTIRLR